MKKIKMFVAGMAIMLAGLFAVPAMAVSCPSGSLRGEAPTIAQCNLPEEEEGTNTQDLFKTVQTIINWILAVLGVVAVVMIIVGGVTYMTSQGDPGKTKRARDTILYGIIGLIIALLAYAIVNFVLTSIFVKQ